MGKGLPETKKACQFCRSEGSKAHVKTRSPSGNWRMYFSNKERVGERLKGGLDLSIKIKRNSLERNVPFFDSSGVNGTIRTMM